MPKSFRLFAFIACAALAAAHAQSAGDPDINKKIRAEENDHSQILHTMHFLADVYGPRLTGSPNHKAAADWALKQMKEWGLENGHLEPWDFGHPGWMNERASGYIVAPIHDQLTFKVLAWTPGTKGTITAAVFQLIPPEKPKQDDLTKYLDSIKGQIKDKIVMVGKAEFVPVVIDVPARRMDDKAAAERFDPKNPNAGQFGPRNGQQPPQDPPGTLTGQQINQQIDEFLLANGALVRANDARMGNGRIRAFQNRTYDIAKVVPTVVLRNEDYGRIARILADGSKVELEFNIENKSFPEGKTTYNTVAEIPGTDKKDEVVMLGGHLDSWHSATGATDNAIGCAIMMEAARILKTLGIKPRRTIRIALWSGEEEGLLGSRRSVKKTFADPAPMQLRPAHEKFAAYFNIDNGTGKVRGIYLQGNEACRPIFTQWLQPFQDLGATTVTISNTGGTDHQSFDAVGLPGFQFIQDEIEYSTRTHHSNMDSYDHLIEDDLKQIATIVSTFVYNTPQRDENLPRKPLPEPRPNGRGRCS